MRRMVEMPRVGFARVLAEVGERRRRRGLKAPLMTPPGVDIKSTVYSMEKWHQIMVLSTSRENSHALAFGLSHLYVPRDRSEFMGQA